MKRIKWKNIIAIIFFTLSSLVLLHDLIIVCTTIAGFTYFGVVTFLLALTIFGTTLNYLDEEYKKVSAKELADTNKEKL